MQQLTLKYQNEDDKAYGLAGMAIALAALDALDRVAGVSLDSDGPMVTFSNEFYFSALPRCRQNPPGTLSCTIITLNLGNGGEQRDVPLAGPPQNRKCPTRSVSRVREERSAPKDATPAPLRMTRSRTSTGKPPPTCGASSVTAVCTRPSTTSPERSHAGADVGTRNHRRTAPPADYMTR